MSSAQLPLQRGQNNENNKNSSPDQDQTQQLNAVDPVTTGTSKSKKKKKKKKKKNNNATTETRNNGETKDVHTESPVDPTIGAEVKIQNETETIDAQTTTEVEKVKEDPKLPEVSNVQDVVESESIRATEQGVVPELAPQSDKVAEEAQLEVTTAAEEPQQPKEINEAVVNAALSETVEDINESVPDEKSDPQEPLQVQDPASMNPQDTVQHQDQAPVEAELAESVDEIKESIPEEELIPRESELPATSKPVLEVKPEDNAPTGTELTESVEQTKETVLDETLLSQGPVGTSLPLPESKPDDIIPAQSALCETVESIKEIDPNDVVVPETKFEDEFASTKSIDGMKAKEPEAEIIPTPTQETHQDDPFGSSTNEISLPWESKDEQPQASDVLFGGSGEQTLPWDSEKTSNIHEAVPVQYPSKAGDLFENIESDETLPWGNQEKTEATSAVVSEQGGPIIEQPQTTDEIFRSSKEDDFSALISSEDNLKTKSPQLPVEEPKVETAQDIKSQLAASDDLFGASEKDDFNLLITGASDEHTEESAGKPEKKFSFLELELDDELLEDDQLLDGETVQPAQQQEPIEQPRARSYKPVAATNSATPTPHSQYQPQHQYQHQANVYNPYGSPSHGQAAPNAIPHHLNIKELNDNKKKSDAYDFPIDLVSKNTAKPVRINSQNRFGHPQPAFAQQPSAISSPGLNQCHASPVAPSAAHPPTGPVSQATHSPYAPRAPSTQAAPSSGLPPGPPRSNTPGSVTSSTSKPLPTMKKKAHPFFEELPILPPAAPAKHVRRVSSVSATGSLDGGLGGPNGPAGYLAHPTQAPPPNPYANASNNLPPPRMPASSRYSQPSSPLISQTTPMAPPNPYAAPSVPTHQPYGQSPYAPAQVINQPSSIAAATAPAAPPVGKPSKYAPVAQPQSQLQPNLSNVVPGLNPLNARRASFTQPMAPGPVTYQQPAPLAYSPNVPPPAITTNLSVPAPAANILSPSTPAASKYAPINHRRQASSTANQYDPYSLTKVQQQQQKQQGPPIQSQQHSYPPQAGMMQPPMHLQSQGHVAPPAVHHQQLPPVAEKVVNPEQLLKRQFPLFSWGNGGRLTYLIPSSSYMQPNVNIVSTDKVLQDASLKEFPSVTKKNISAIEKYLDNQIEKLSTSLSSQAEENELLLLQVLKYKLSKSAETFNLGSTYNYIEAGPSFSEASLRTHPNQPLSKRQLIALISNGQNEQALSLALSHQDYALALLISSVIGKDSWLNMVRTYLGNEFRGDNGLFVSTLFQILSGDAKSVISDFKSDPAKSSWAIIHWKELSNAVISNKPISLIPFVTEFGTFLIESGYPVLGYILFFLGDVPIPGFLCGHSVKFILYLEIYGLIFQEKGVYPDLSPVLFSHASYLADYNLLAESQRYLDTATSQFKASKVVNPKVSYTAKKLSERLSGSGVSEGSWFVRPKLDRVWGTLDKSLNKFIAGEEASKPHSKEGGVFSKFSPTVSRTSSYLSLQNADQQPQAYSNGQRQPSQTAPLHRPNMYAPTGISSEQDTFLSMRAPAHHGQAPVPAHASSYSSPSLKKPDSKLDLKANEALKSSKPPLPTNPYAPVQQSQQPGSAAVPLPQPPKVGGTPLSSRASSPRASLADLYGTNSSNLRASRYAPPASNSDMPSRRSSVQSNSGSSHFNESSTVNVQSYAPPWPSIPGSVSAPLQQTISTPPPPPPATLNAYKPPVAESSLPTVSQIPSHPQSPQRVPRSESRIAPPLISRANSAIAPPASVSRTNSGIAPPPKVNKYGPPPMAKSSAPPLVPEQPVPVAVPFEAPVVSRQEPVLSIVPEQQPIVIGPEVEEDAPKEEFLGESALGKQVELTGPTKHDFTSVNDVVESHVQELAVEEAREEEQCKPNENMIDQEDGFKHEKEDFDPESDFDPEGVFNDGNRAESEEFDVGPSIVTQYESPKNQEKKHGSVEEPKEPTQLSFDAPLSLEPQESINHYAPPPPSNPYFPPTQAEKKEEFSTVPPPPANPSAPPTQVEKANEEPSPAPDLMGPPEISGPPKIPAPSPYAPKNSASPSAPSKKSSSAGRFTPRSYTLSNASHEAENFAVSGDIGFNAFGGGYTPPNVSEISTYVTHPVEPKRVSVSKTVAPNPYSPVSQPAAVKNNSPIESKFNPYQPSGLHSAGGQSFDGTPSGVPTLSAKQPSPSQFAPLQASDDLSQNSTISSTYTPPSAKFTAYEPPQANSITPVPEDDEYYDDVIEDEDEDDDDDDDETTSATNTTTSSKMERKGSVSKRDKDQSGWFGWLRKDKNEPKVYRAKLGEENKLVYDENLKRWVDKNAKPEDLKAAATPPPPPVIKKKPSSISKPRSDSVSDSGSLKSPNMSPAPSLPGVRGPSPGTATGAPPLMPKASGLPPPRNISAANDLDSLIGLSGAGALGAASTRRKKRGGRGYVDVMGSMQQQKK